MPKRRRSADESSSDSSDDDERHRHKLKKAKKAAKAKDKASKRKEKHRKHKKRDKEKDAEVSPACCARARPGAGWQLGRPGFPQREAHGSAARRACLQWLTRVRARGCRSARAAGRAACCRWWSARGWTGCASSQRRRPGRRQRRRRWLSKCASPPCACAPCLGNRAPWPAATCVPSIAWSLWRAQRTARHRERALGPQQPRPDTLPLAPVKPVRRSTSRPARAVACQVGGRTLRRGRRAGVDARQGHLDVPGASPTLRGRCRRPHHMFTKTLLRPASPCLRHTKKLQARGGARRRGTLTAAACASRQRTQTPPSACRSGVRRCSWLGRACPDWGACSHSLHSPEVLRGCS